MKILSFSLISKCCSNFIESFTNISEGCNRSQGHQATVPGGLLQSHRPLTASSERLMMTNKSSNTEVQKNVIFGDNFRDLQKLSVWMIWFA